MSLTWKQSPTDGPEGDVITREANKGGAFYEIRTLQLSDPPGFAVVAWEGNEGIWESWSHKGRKWYFGAEHESATEAKNAAEKPAPATEEPVTEQKPAAAKTTEAAAKTTEAAKDTEAAAKKAETEEKKTSTAADRKTEEKKASTTEAKTEEDKTTDAGAKTVTQGRTIASDDVVPEPVKTEDLATVSVIWGGELRGSPPILVRVEKDRVDQTVAQYEAMGATVNVQKDRHEDDREALDDRRYIDSPYDHSPEEDKKEAKAESRSQKSDKKDEKADTKA